MSGLFMILLMLLLFVFLTFFKYKGPQCCRKCNILSLMCMSPDEYLLPVLKLV